MSGGDANRAGGDGDYLLSYTWFPVEKQFIITAVRQKKQEDSPLKTPPTKKAGGLASENATGQKRRIHWWWRTAGG